MTGVVRAGDVKELQALGDAVREKLGSGVGVLAASFEDGKNTLLVVVTDDLRERGLRADALIKDIAAAAGGRGGGKPHMAQAGVPDAARFGEALARAPELVRDASGRRRVTVGDWLREKEPVPPARLAARIESAIGGRPSEPAANAAEVCLEACERLLADVAARTSQGRESALDLLAADALATYALEAATESSDDARSARARRDETSHRDRRRMIDIHTHLLPGVDDGSKSLESSLEVLRRFASDGVTTVVCTPHLEASHAHEAPHERHEEIFAQLVAASVRPPELRRGWEIMLDVPAPISAILRLGLGGSTARLVEFARLGLPANSDKDLSRIRESGLVPVVAHPSATGDAHRRSSRRGRRRGR